MRKQLNYTYKGHHINLMFETSIPVWDVTYQTPYKAAVASFVLNDISGDVGSVAEFNLSTSGFDVIFIVQHEIKFDDTELNVLESWNEQINGGTVDHGVSSRIELVEDKEGNSRYYMFLTAPLFEGENAHNYVEEFVGTTQTFSPFSGGQSGQIDSPARTRLKGSIDGVVIFDELIENTFPAEELSNLELVINQLIDKQKLEETMFAAFAAGELDGLLDPEQLKLKEQFFAKYTDV
jgi:hypothetical protein